jgi:hypothetical protein
LKNLNVVGMIAKYDSFYLPELFPETASQSPQSEKKE